MEEDSRSTNAVNADDKDSGTGHADGGPSSGASGSSSAALNDERPRAGAGGHAARAGGPAADPSGGSGGTGETGADEGDTVGATDAGTMMDAAAAASMDAAADTEGTKDASADADADGSIGQDGSEGSDASGDGGDIGEGGEAGADSGGMDEDPTMDHCITGFRPHPSDATMSGTPMEWVSPKTGEIDLVVPQPVLDWMAELHWPQAHDAWHNIRRCSRMPSQPICVHTDMIPEDQECENAQDGFNFLVSHRHMVMAVREAFPSHPELWQGFPVFPFQATDVPEQWRSRFGTGWSQQIIDTATLLEDIEDHLDNFPTEGDLGKYIQCGLRSNGGGSIHGALHFKWAVNDSPYSLGKQPVNIQNYMFYKLHGWIDNVWERYRIAKGMPPDDQDEHLVQALIDQCHEMHDLGMLFAPADPAPPDELPQESGFFHEKVRPIFESSVHRCSSCHSESSPEAGMSLGGNVSSAEIVAGLVGVQSTYGGQFQRVVPGDPDHSYLYLKAAGLAMSAGCEGEDCRTRMMPPGAITVGQDGALTADELAILRQWIADGAQGP